jgi:NAD(P)-dependent dehydrogenase (short-subunit alcohol dehydrogenase family)
MTRERFADKVAVVTGGGSGIGAETARRLLAEGASVVVGDISADAVRAFEAGAGGRGAGIVADVTREEDVAALIATAVERFGSVDLAFNIAGGSRGVLPIVDMELADWQFTLDLCLASVFLGIKHAARQMIAQGAGGSIVNIASMTARVPVPSGSAYGAAKAGVEMLTRVAAAELGRHGIRVNTVSPGFTDTPAVSAATELYGEYQGRTPLGRVGTVTDIADTLLYLASDGAAFVSGADIIVDGGFTSAMHFDLTALRARRGESS